MGKKVKVVFDTNIWISIFMEKNLKDEFLKVNQEIIVYISEDIGLKTAKTDKSKNRKVPVEPATTQNILNT